VVEYQSKTNRILKMLLIVYKIEGSVTIFNAYIPIHNKTNLNIKMKLMDDFR